MKELQCLLFVYITGLTITVSAQQGPFNAANATGDRFFPALGRVLTDDQRQSLRQIVQAQREQMRPLEQQLRAARQNMLGQITGGQFDESLVRQYAEQSAKAEAELTVMFAKDLSQMQPPLSAAQVKQLKDFQSGRFQDLPDAPGAEPQPHMKLPPPLPRDTNDLPMVQ
jgi:Spy/CpxP family protein refolding chaperone